MRVKFLISCAMLVLALPLAAFAAEKNTPTKVDSIDTIPSVPDAAPICNLGKYGYEGAAKFYAKQRGLPEPVSQEDAFNVLASYVLSDCQDGQLLTIGNMGGVYVFPEMSQKLMAKFCETESIKYEKMTDIPGYAKDWSSIRGLCRISKLSAIRKIIGRE
jgi:hypothetical protein